MEKNPMASKGSPLHGPRIRLIEQAQKLFAETKENMFESKASEEYAKLLRYTFNLALNTLLNGRTASVLYNVKAIPLG